MSISFNLVDQPWIPCITVTGDYQLLGLEQALLQAHQLRSLHDDSPLVLASLYRLLLAILHHNFGPEATEAWAELCKEDLGGFDANTLNGYFHDRHRYTRFDLFHTQRPFYQTTQIPLSTTDSKTGKEKPYAISISKLAQKLDSGNNLFLGFDCARFR
jgi:CRISPR system Cascade subunit CasA